MTRRRALAALAFKELRELGPLWLGLLASLAVMALIRLDRWGDPISVALFALGVVALGTMSVGHEYRHRTLAVLLTQPVRRIHVLAVKMGILVVLLGVLGLVAWASWGGWPLPGPSGTAQEMAVQRLWLVSLACGLFLAPGLTMLFRSELAGMVLALGVPALLIVAGRLGGSLAYGAATADTHEAIEVLRRTVFAGGMVVACAVGVAATFRSFPRMQTVAMRDLDIPLPILTRRRAASARPVEPRTLNPYRALAGNELRLQRLAFVVAGLFVLAWLLMAASTAVAGSPFYADALRNGLWGIYVPVVSLLIGATASAEERHLGTVSFQTLVPFASWKQWAVKVIVVGVLAVALAIGVPQLASAAAPALPLLVEWTTWPLPLGLALVGLYVSSLNSSTIRSFVMSLGVVVFGSLAIGVLTLALNGTFLGRPFVTGSGVIRPVPAWPPFALAALLVFLILRFALINHRSVDRDGRRTVRQIGWMVAVVLVLAVSQASGLVALHP